MSTFLISALAVVFLSVIVSLIVPEGKLKKCVNFVLRIICITALINPIVKLFNDNTQIENVTINYDYICEVYSKTQSKTLEDDLYEKFGERYTCNVNIEYIEGKICERGVIVWGDFKNQKDIAKIEEYLQGLGYINITVNEEVE